MFCYFLTEKKALEWAQQCEGRWGRDIIRIGYPITDIRVNAQDNVRLPFSVIVKTSLNQIAFQKAGLEPPSWKYG
jgi:hypothetical protein